MSERKLQNACSVTGLKCRRKLLWKLKSWKAEKIKSLSRLWGTILIVQSYSLLTMPIFQFIFILSLVQAWSTVIFWQLSPRHSLKEMLWQAFLTFEIFRREYDESLDSPGVEISATWCPASLESLGGTAVNILVSFWRYFQARDSVRAEILPPPSNNSLDST